MPSRIPRVVRTPAIVLRHRRLGDADRIVTLLTPGIVLAESSSSDIVRTDLTRLWFTLVGAVVTIVVLVVLHPVFARMHRSASPASGSGQSPAVEGNSPAS